MGISCTIPGVHCDTPRFDFVRQYASSFPCVKSGDVDDPERPPLAVFEQQLLAVVLMFLTCDVFDLVWVFQCLRESSTECRLRLPYEHVVGLLIDVLCVAEED